MAKSTGIYANNRRGSGGRRYPNRIDVSTSPDGNKFGDVKLHKMPAPGHKREGWITIEVGEKTRFIKHQLFDENQWAWLFLSEIRILK